MAAVSAHVSRERFLDELVALVPPLNSEKDAKRWNA